VGRYRFERQTLRLWKIPKVTASRKTVLIETRDSILVSDTIELGQLKFGPNGDILAGSLANGDINLWQVPDGTLRAVLKGDGSHIRSMYFQPNGLRVTAAAESGDLARGRSKEQHQPGQKVFRAEQPRGGRGRICRLSLDQLEVWQLD